MTKKKTMEPRIFMFDTHQHIKALQSAGFNEKQAEVIVRSLLESREIDMSHLATKEQIINLDNKMNALEKQVATKEDIKDLEIKIAQSQASILKWMIATVIAFSGVIIAAIPLVIKHFS